MELHQVPDHTPTTRIIKADGVLVAIAPQIRIDKPWVQAGGLRLISPNAWALFMALEAHCGKGRFVWPSISRLLDLTGLARRTLFRAMEELFTEQTLPSGRKWRWIKNHESEPGRSTLREIIGPPPIEDLTATPATPPSDPAPTPVNSDTHPPSKWHHRRTTRKYAQGREQQQLPLLEPLPPPPAWPQPSVGPSVDAAVAAFLLALGVEGRWIDAHAAGLTLARCKEARDYAQPRCKSGGFVGYLIRTLERGWGVKGQKRPVHAAGNPPQTQMPPPGATAATPIDLSHPQMRQIDRQGPPPTPPPAPGALPPSPIPPPPMDEPPPRQRTQAEIDFFIRQEQLRLVGRFRRLL